jgi:hypothetical protein
MLAGTPAFIASYSVPRSLCLQRPITTVRFSPLTCFHLFPRYVSTHHSSGTSGVRRIGPKTICWSTLLCCSFLQRPQLAVCLPRTRSGISPTSGAKLAPRTPTTAATCGLARSARPRGCSEAAAVDAADCRAWHEVLVCCISPDSISILLTEHRYSRRRALLVFFSQLSGNICHIHFPRPGVDVCRMPYPRLRRVVDVDAIHGTTGL